MEFSRLERLLQDLAHGPGENKPSTPVPRRSISRSVVSRQCAGANESDERSVEDARNDEVVPASDEHLSGRGASRRIPRTVDAQSVKARTVDTQSVDA